MNKRKTRALIDSVVSQLTAESQSLIDALNGLKTAHNEQIKIAFEGVEKNRYAALAWHSEQISIINKVIRQVQS